MTLNHGHLECINKTEKLQRKSQMAIAPAADCRKQVAYVYGTSGNSTSLTSASLGPFPSGIWIVAVREKRRLLPEIADDHHSRILGCTHQIPFPYHLLNVPCNFCGLRIFGLVLACLDTNFPSPCDLCSWVELPGVADELQSRSTSPT